MEGERQTLQSIKAELSLFDGPSFQVTHLKGQWAELLPENQYKGTEQVTIDIKIPKAEGWYLDFNDAFLLTDLSIVKDDDAKSAIGGNDDVALVNFAGAAFFKDVKLVGSGQKIEGENQSYMYKAYLYTLLSASVSAKKYQLAIAGWERDEAEKFDIATNKGHEVRKAWTVGSATHQL